MEGFPWRARPWSHMSYPERLRNGSIESIDDTFGTVLISDMAEPNPRGRRDLGKRCMESCSLVIWRTACPGVRMFSVDESVQGVMTCITLAGYLSSLTAVGFCKVTPPLHLQLRSFLTVTLISIIAHL